MRNEQEIVEELDALRTLEKEAALKFMNAFELDLAVQISNISSVLCFAMWLLEKTEMKFSTLINITEVSKQGLIKGIPVEDIMEFAQQKIHALSQKKENN